MKINPFLFISGLLISFSASSQSLSPTVISSGGGFSSAGAYTLSHTEGESVISTLSQSSNILTQGFQQPDKKNTGIPTIEKSPEATFTLFPNPTSDYSNLLIESLNIQDFILDILDLNGKILQSEFTANIQNGPIRIDLQGKAAGTYFLRIRTKTKNFSKTLKIQKTDY